MGDGFHEFYWVEFYKDAKEFIPIDEPVTRGREVGIHCFLDASHASDEVTRRSQTGIIIFVNKDLIKFYSKRHNYVDNSTLVSEFTAMKQAIE